LEAAPSKKSTKGKDKEETKTGGLAKDISIVYCIDVSGSMSGTRLQAVQGTILA
jgi:Mg-chelatase subunit ChlD